ncbi:helix-turn-helix domain-containing protein [Siphonobacter aquaeclarae]|uniref:AraC-type DNA-binding protein n=1 Tax=Siphonobacter aquaeclarae TaxID=563176 RepID=A0A1G9HL04_9BACT|nr:helix-turn-helix transcriptional regulator [Siphonobacter aquaeclarae]SDL13650.1 AraC-type DNA-binding protein [Siphonobacter aquaeclarae]
MQKKFNLKSFNLYEFLKHQNAYDQSVPFFLADRHTYEKAHVNFPFRTFAYGIGITYSGPGDIFKIGSTDYFVTEGSLTTVGPGMVCQWTGNYVSEHDTVYFTEKFFSDLQTHSFLHSLPFFFHGGKHVIALTAEQTKKMASLFGLLKELKDDRKAVPGIVHSLLMLVDSFHSADPSRNSPVSNREKIASSFRKLVAEQFAEHKEVAFYADQLHITPKYLSEVLQAELGKPAKVFIDEYVMMEARSLLKQTAFSVQEICQWLGFEDASHFARVFKRATGETPTQYRKV